MELVQPIKDKRQIEAMKRYLRGTSLRDYCLFEVGINSGLRISDLLSLKVEDVLDDRGKVRDRIAIREKKTSKHKEFPLAANVTKAVTEYMATRPTAKPEEPLFLSRKRGAHLQRGQAWQILSDAAKAVGIRGKIGSHSLRKTFGYWAYTHGYDITRIQQLLNHSSPGVTLRYIGITQEELDDVHLSLNL